MSTTIASVSGTTILASAGPWERYRDGRDLTARDELVATLMPMLSAALALQPSVPGPERGRRTKSGVRALLNAVDSYDGDDVAGLRLHVWRSVTRRLDRFTQ